MNHQLCQSPWYQSVLDRARTAFYVSAMVVAIGSLWTIAWANSLDSSRAFSDPDRTAAVCPAGSDASIPPGNDAP